MKLDGKIALITGASRGIGKEISKEFLKNGAIVIINYNAGISSFNMLVDTTINDFNNIMDINFKSVYLLSREVLKSMMYEKGVILNISSMWGEYGSSCEVLYSASKGAVNAFTKALAKEVSPMGVRVNGIAPGAIDTDMNKHFTEDERKDIEEMCLLGRLGTVEEIAKVALFLCSDDSSFITGEIVSVTGGKI